MSHYEEETIIQTLQRVRRELEADLDGDLRGGVTITIQGTFNAHTGDMSITFQVSDGWGGKFDVKGPDFTKVLAEAYRQVQAKKELEPLCLPRV